MARSLRLLTRRRRRRSRLPYLSLLAWISVLVAGYAAVAPGPTRLGIGSALDLCQGPRQHDCVIDGDTIRYGGSTIRIEDIDAPETFEPRCLAEQRLGRRATDGFWSW